MKRILIAGSGPAGLAAALAASSSADVTVCERMRSPGLKLLASGGGKCNISNRLNPAEFMAKFGRNGRFMSNALSRFGRDGLFAFLRENGVECVLEDSFHYFPKSHKSSDVLNAFQQKCAANGAAFRTGTAVARIVCENNTVKAAVLSSGERLEVDALILACGGTAWPALGGTSAGLTLAASVGHTIRKPYPAMAPVIVSEKWVGTLAGVSFPNAELTLKKNRCVGELLFTHNGFSGPCALDLAGEAAENAPVPLYFRADASMTRPDWIAELERWRKNQGVKQIKTLLGWKFTQSFAERICEIAGCSGIKACELSAGPRDALAEALTALKLNCTGAAPMEKAMAMRGGVSLKEIDPDTLKSKLIGGLYFAGEIMDLVGPCGGYNIQWAFSSGYTAGLCAAKNT